MALVKCPECSAEISDKAGCCPKCGAPIVVQSQPVVSANTGGYKSGVSSTPAFVVNHKRNLAILITILIITAIALAIALVTLQNNGSSNKIPNPNRTQEDCTFLGTANVYPALHANGNCLPDGDGYFYPGFGHHHHK